MALCRVLAVARSADDAWARRGVSAHAQADAPLATRIALAHARSRRTDGAPRIHAALRAAGVRCARKRVARLLRAAGLAGGRRRRRARTTVTDPAHTPAPNLVARDFAAPTVDHRWLGDSTSVPTGAGWLYLAVLLDAHARRVIGWALADHLRAELALDQRRPGARLVHHTDRGCQYTAAAYRAILASSGVTASLSRTGNGDDNAMAKRSCATLQAEMIDPRPGRHAALGYRAPVAHEAQHMLLLLQHQAA